MIIGWCSICVFAALINKVCLQVTVEAVIGGSVVLPCSSTEHDLKVQDISVFWRHNGSETIYDLIRGNDSVAEQNPRYKNRAKTFPDEYLRGNFSIKLINLQHTDAGEFSCFIIHSSDSKQETVWLLINESIVEKGSNSTDQANQEPETNAHQWHISDPEYNTFPEGFTKGRFPLILIWWFVCVFAVLINKVSLQVTVEGVIGGSVVLPCSSAEHDLKLQDIDVHWRDKNDKIVYSIIKGEHSVAGQDPQYKDRVETFPSEYLRGNFSIKLSGLTHADAGQYICYITPSDEQETVQLIIKEKEKGEYAGAVSAGTSSHYVYIVLPALFIVLIA
ncbi:hypothetical protein G5714_021875 [Onychostoma macrolepis]|uniref:Ig-like domain-containing protein n=1 Tax=Onychostoma macrolepis TaxID=369639 RepID=A0A7J6BS93_9TELE|nr:hypothetical protein G5714_021875 [Onychostoma macrolepis]